MIMVWYSRSAHKVPQHRADEISTLPVAGQSWRTYCRRLHRRTYESVVLWWVEQWLFQPGRRKCIETRTSHQTMSLLTHCELKTCCSLLDRWLTGDYAHICSMGSFLGHSVHSYVSVLSLGCFEGATLTLQNTAGSKIRQSHLKTLKLKARRYQWCLSALSWSQWLSGQGVLGDFAS